MDINHNLCTYDPRNPNNTRDEDTIPYEQYASSNPDCSCDNCFYGRTTLAKMIIQLQEENQTERAAHLVTKIILKQYKDESK